MKEPSPQTGERRLAAIMFIDMVGFSALTQRNEMLALQLLEQGQNQVRPLLEKHKGREVKTTGDGVLVEFASSLEAVIAVEIQSILKENKNVPMGKVPGQDQDPPG
jgi:class 3 adenylate cyclase